MFYLVPICATNFAKIILEPHFRGQLQMCVAVGKSSCCERMRYVETVLEVCLEAESL